MSAAKKGSSQTWELTGSWAGAWKIAAGIGVVGLLGAGAGFASDPRRFAFSWLSAFITVLLVPLGAIFFVLIQRLTSAGWSVTVRRTAEFFGYGVLVLIPLFIPILISMGHLFPWLGGHGGGHGGEHHGSVDTIELIKPAYAQPHGEPNKNPHPSIGGTHGEPGPAGVNESGGHLPGTMRKLPSDTPPVFGGRGPGHVRGPAQDPHALTHADLIKKKAGYLNKNFFLARAGIYFVIWILLAVRLFGYSTAQDKSKDPSLTVAAQRFAPPATMLFALSLTFAVFDWVMSLEPTWFSTIFGVVMFASGVVSSLAVIILVTMSLRAAGPLEGAVTVEHFHDLGKLMFGFLVFWAYVSFSQYMLIWYAALPEETTFFHNRMDYAPWSKMTTAIILFHFVLPFFWLISRNFKRNLGRLQIGAAILLVMHAVNIYWYVMPNYLLGQEGFSFHWMDIACLLGVGGIYAAFVFHRMTQFPLVPIGDPRLERSLHFQNA